MGYCLGIDVGTTFTAAAVVRDGRPDMVVLGTQSAAVPTMVFLGDDGEVLVGEAARRRLQADPTRVAREFKRRLGDATPLFVGGVPRSGESLVATVLRWVVGLVVQQEGGRPDAIVVTHPANWGPYRRELLEAAIRQAEIGPATPITEPEAAAISYASNARVEPGRLVAVYDLGGGTFDAAILRKTETGFEVAGTPEGIEHLGGLDVDEAVFEHVRAALGGALDSLDLDDPNTLRSLQRLREECTQAKEALSFDATATVPVLLPGVQTEVRITRAELEAKIRPLLADTVASMRRAFAAAGARPEDAEAVVLVGGSSRIPLVAELITTELGRPVAVDTQPKHAVALGAALAAAASVGPAAAEAEAPTSAPVPPPTAPVAMATEATEPAGQAEVEPVPVATAEPVMAAAPVEAPPSAPVDAGEPPPGRRRKGLVVAGVVAVVAAVAIGFALSGGDKGGDLAAGGGGTTTTTAAAEESTTTTAEATTTTRPPDVQPLLPDPPAVEASAPSDSPTPSRVQIDDSLQRIFLATYDLQTYDLINLAPRGAVGFEETGVDTDLLIANGMAYFGTNEGGLTAIDLDTAAVRWQVRDLGAVYTTPVLYDGTKVVVGTDQGRLGVYDAATGAAVGTFEVGQAMFAPPVINGDEAIYVTDQELRSVDLTTGHITWRVPFDGESGVGTPAIDGNLVYALTATKLYQVELDTGVVDATVEGYGAFEATTGPVVANGSLYWGTGGTGTLENISIPDLQAGSDPFYAGAPVRTPPLVQDGVVYFGSEDGNVYAARADTLEWLWVEPMAGPVTGGFSIANGKLYAADDSHIYAIILPEVPPP